MSGEGANDPNQLYVSSVPPNDERFEAEHLMVECSSEGCKSVSIASIDLSVLRNKLVNWGVPFDKIIFNF